MQLAGSGLRSGEIAGLQWIRAYLDDDAPHLDIDPKFGALHEVRGKLELGWPDELVRSAGDDGVIIGVQCVALGRR